MDILLADSDRDFLQCYQKLLTLDGHSVTAAFDGAQAVSLLGAHKYDVCILEESLPRIGNEEILRFLKTEGIPVIVLTEGGVTVKMLLKPLLPNDYLPFPFLPADLTRLIQQVTEKTRAGSTVSIEDVDIDVSGFCLSGTQTMLTNGEIDLLAALKSPVKAAGKRTRITVQALNEKLKRAGKRTRIVYETEKGYRLVSENG